MTDEQKTNSAVVDWTENEHDVDVEIGETAAEEIEAIIPDELAILPLRGVVVFGDYPNATLNGQAARLSPGSRVRGADNMAVMSPAIAGAKLLVHYTVDVGSNFVKALNVSGMKRGFYHVRFNLTQGTRHYTAKRIFRL